MSVTKSDFAEFIELFCADDKNLRKETYFDAPHPEGKGKGKGKGKGNGRWRCFNYDEFIARDKTNLDIFWLKDESLEDTENLPPPEVLAQEIVEQLQSALDEFKSVEAILTVNGD